MKEINYISIYLSIIFLFISLVRAQDADFDTSVDHFKDKVLLDSSNGFQVEYFKWYKVLTNTIRQERYALVCCGQTLNDTEGYDAVISTPVKTISIDNKLGTLPYIELLNKKDTVVSATPSEQITSPCFSNLTTNDTTTTDVTFNYEPIDNSKHVCVSSNDSSLTPMEQASWIVYIGYFFEQELFAQQILSDINDIYACHKHNLEKKGSKNIAWSFYNSDQSWTLHYTPFLKSLIEDAGMTLVAPDNQTTTFQDLNAFQKVLANVDYIIDDTPLANFNGTGSYANWLSAGGFNANNQSEAFIANKNVYRTDRIINTNGYSDWPIRQSARADLALSDVIHMVDNTYEPTYNMTWLRAYAQMENPKFVTTAVYPSCTDPLVSLDLSQCTFNSSSGEDSSDVEVQDARMKQGLSTGGKIGIAVGVVVGVVLLLFISLFAYRKYASSQPKKAERTNFQYQEGV